MKWLKNIFNPNVAVEAEDETDYPDSLTVLPLKDAVLMPNSILPLLVTNANSAARIRRIHENNEPVLALAMKKPAEVSEAGWDNLYQVGCMARITKISEIDDNDLSIMVKGIRKASLEKKISERPRMKAQVNYIDEDLEQNREVLALAHSTRKLLEQLARYSYHNMETILSNLSRIKDPLILFSTCATTLPVSVEKKQVILEENSLTEKFHLLYNGLKEELDILELSSKITADAKGEISNAQREYYLRQQMKAIRKELGEKDDPDNEIDELKADLEACNLPDEVAREVFKDVKRIARMQPGSSEYVTIRTYLDWILDLPWNEHTDDNLEINAVEDILNQDHFDLRKPKKRILEFLAVKKLKGDLKGPILRFVGPPGVGKTSLGKSIARAMDRKFVRISLGGVRDEAEIRGHRRTYIGAMPGRIISGLKQAETVNPVFMLDEIDKLSKDVHGDPASALLEALDPEQNSTFVDHYLNVPYDLSQVFFITTANVLDDIPLALRDRLEIVEVEGYTQEDKLEIARQYLIPKERSANGLDGSDITFDDQAIIHVIRYYTRESGVRSLQREIAAVLRSIAASLARGEQDRFRVDPEFVTEALGPIRYLPEARQRINVPGVATGLAWTPFGGEILFMESALVKGREEMILTGQMGDVMKESARIALSLIKSMGHRLPENEGLHIHVPSGAIPKDGPSAGVTLITSLISLLSGKTVTPELAMTGEITLRGVVLPVGGIKEKVLAAKRAGIKRIILPRMNAKDLKDIEGGDTLSGIEIHLVENIEEVLSLAFPQEDEREIIPTPLHFQQSRDDNRPARV